MFIDVMFAFVLTFMVEGQPQNIIIDYTVTPVECQVKVNRIKKVITSPVNTTNIVDAFCMLLNVHVDRKAIPTEPKKYEKEV